MIGVACGSQDPAGATPPSVLRRSTSTTCASSPVDAPVWVASRFSSAMLPAPLSFLVTTLPVTALPSGACHCGGPAARGTEGGGMPAPRGASPADWGEGSEPPRGAGP